MGDRYHAGHGHPRPQYRDDRGDRHARDDRYNYEDRYDRYERRDRHEHPRSRSPPRRDYGRFNDRHNGYNAVNGGYRRNDEYQFRGAADRGQSYRPPPQSDFTFQASGPRFPANQPYPPPRPLEARTQGPRRDQGRRGPPGQHGGKAFAAGARVPFRKPPPHQRDILRRQEGNSTPEQLHGMNEEGQARFGEANFSTSEEDGSEDGEIDDSAMDEGDGPRKRVKADAADSEAQAAPKWSNPEYFTALPPPESGGGPKKDIVQVIRKAKIDAAPRQDSSNAVKENADFISFSMDEDVVDLGSMKLNDSGAEPNEPKPPKRQRKPKDALLAPAQRADEVQAEPREKPAKRPPKSAPTAPLESMNQANQSIDEPQEDPAPKKRRPKQFDPIGPPPQPPMDIDHMMSVADRMAPKKQPLAKATPQQSSEPKGKKRKAALISKGLGDVLAEWVDNGTNPTPWCTVDHTKTANVGFRLHKEIADFYEFVRPHDYEEAVRHDLIQRVQRSVRTFYSADAARVEIRSFGSFASGVYLPTADMDLVAVSPSYLQNGRKVFCQSKSSLYKLARHLENQNVAAPATMTVVAKAKVPIIKFTEKQTGIKVDISFENDTGLVALRTFAEWKEKYPAMPVIVVLIKQMLAMRGMNEVFLGGLGGFSIICLVVSVMQHMPEIQSGNMNSSLHYSDLLLNFLDLYGNKFNLQTTGIVMDPPEYFDKIRHPHQKQNHNGLTIIDPNNPDNDISGGSNKIATVFQCFRTAHSEIQRRLAQIHSGENIEDSILGVVLAGNYTSFISQRNRLSKHHRGQAASPISISETEDYYDADVQDQPKQRNPKPPGGGRGRGGKAKSNHRERRLAAFAPEIANRKPQSSQMSNQLPPRPATNGAFNAGSRRYETLRIDPEQYETLTSI